MIKYVGGRATGKTYRLLQDAAENKLEVLVSTIDRKYHLENYAKELGFDVQIICWADYNICRLHPDIIRDFDLAKHRIVIEDADLLLKTILYDAEIYSLSLSATDLKRCYEPGRIGDLR